MPGRFWRLQQLLRPMLTHTLAYHFAKPLRLQQQWRLRHGRLHTCDSFAFVWRMQQLRQLRKISLSSKTGKKSLFFDFFQ